MEGEALLLGSWKNVEEIEEVLTFEELELIVKAGREKEYRLMRFYAAFKGVDLDEDSEQEDVFEAVQRRAEAKLSGKSEEEIEFSGFGIDVDNG